MSSGTSSGKRSGGEEGQAPSSRSVSAGVNSSSTANISPVSSTAADLSGNAMRADVKTGPAELTAEGAATVAVTAVATVGVTAAASTAEALAAVRWNMDGENQ